MSVSWFELQVPDLDAAQSFYGAVFGWTFAPMGEGVPYVLISDSAGQLVGGMNPSSDPVAGRHVRVYFGTDEMETLLAKVPAAGGAVIEPRTFITEDYGWYATITDPGGLKIGITTGKPPA